MLFVLILKGSENNKYSWRKWEAKHLGGLLQFGKRIWKSSRGNGTRLKFHVCYHFSYYELDVQQFKVSFQEAVKKVFQRALQYCDPKKVHLALLGVYERTEQHTLADELVERMVKKFKHSCKVIWFLFFVSLHVKVFCLTHRWTLNVIFCGILDLAETGAETFEARARWCAVCYSTCSVMPSPS